MDSLPSPLAFFLLLFSGWVNRHQQAVIDTCSKRTVSSAQCTVPDGFASPTTSGAAWP
jgi:hypothetical protein